METIKNKNTMATKTYIAFLVSDRGSEQREVYASSEVEAMNKIFASTSEDTILKSIYQKF